MQRLDVTSLGLGLRLGLGLGVRVGFKGKQDINEHPANQTGLLISFFSYCSFMSCFLFLMVPFLKAYFIFIQPR